MIEGRSDDFSKHFLVTHFFNPVRYMRLLELVAGEDTDPRGRRSSSPTSASFRLGKGIVYGKDTPNFVGNRIGVFGIAGDDPRDDGDGLPGRRGRRHHRPGDGPPQERLVRHRRPRRPRHLVARGQHPARGLPGRRGREPSSRSPTSSTKMVEEGLLGRKTKAPAASSGARRVRTASKTDFVLDWKTGEYRPKERPSIPSLKARPRGIHDVGDPACATWSRPTTAPARSRGG